MTFCEVKAREGREKAAANALDAEEEELKGVGDVGEFVGADPTTFGRAGNDDRL